MRKLLGKTLIFGLLLSLLFTLPVMAAVPDTGAHAVLLADLETGNILYAKNPDEKVYPASTTKLMTALLAMESCDLGEKVVGTENASWGLDGQSTRIYIADGEEFTLAQLMDAMLI
ncbi:MAG: D-alanyl-D-alanine carboxypeptidase, partial [Clostridia bacterium]|nr:D-alanyl-D-alanine carboxypeptidase [Clostridia bacterium]